MEPLDHFEHGTVQMSNSPARAPQIMQGLKSPVRSLHPQLQRMQSSNSQQAPGLRTLDFFNDSSGDEVNSHVDPANTASDMDGLERRGSATKKRGSQSPIHPLASLASRCESKTVTLSPIQDGYQPLSPTVWADAPDQVRERADSPSTSFNGSVDELLPSNLHSSPPPFLRHSCTSTGRTPRSSTHIQRSDDRQSSAPTARTGALFGAYAIAHEITLQALMRDEEGLDRSLQGLPLAPLPPADRRSLLPAALSVKDDPRSPKVRESSSPPQGGSAKKVQVVPPPIHVGDAGRRSIPNNILRTPYPFSPEHVQREDFGEEDPPTDSPPFAPASSESVLTLSIRRSHANSKPRVTTITIPASNDFTAVRNSGLRQKEQHFRALDYDDAELFRQIRTAYRQLRGPQRLLSPRSLFRIVLGGATAAADSSSPAWPPQPPRSPRELACQGLHDTLSEAQTLQHFRRRAAGKSQYAFVHWAHRLAAAPAAQTPQPGEEDSGEQRWRREAEAVRWMEQSPEGLQFVVGWSARRIGAVLLLVLLSSTAAALLWTLLGPNTAPMVPGQGHGGGFRGAGGRVAGGVLLGICVLLVGLGGMGGWLGISWLLM